MVADDVRARLDEMCTHVNFMYKKKIGGVDPITRTHFDMWYGEETYTAKSLDEAMTYPIFDGNSLQDIADKVEFLSGM